MKDRRMAGQIVLFLGVLLVALPSALGFLAGIQVDQALNLVLSIAGVVLTLLGMAMYYLASRSAS
jgi:drug/metabolite transporter (DMT)-like permease